MAPGISEQENRVLIRVIEMLGSGQALAQDLEDYVVGFHVLGNLAASAQAETETAEMNTKIAWAEAFATAKEGENKVSDMMAKAQADIAVADLKHREILKRERLHKIRATRDSVQEAIWAIKSLTKNGG